MATLAVIEDFVAQKRLALVGASRNGKKFGNTVLREMSAKGYTVKPVHPEAAAVDGVACVRALADLRGQVDGVVVVVPPERAATVVRAAAEAGIRRVWLQQGAESAEASRIAAERGVALVDRECILMYAAPVKSFHAVHRWLRTVFRRMPR